MKYEKIYRGGVARAHVYIRKPNSGRWKYVGVEKLFVCVLAPNYFDTIKTIMKDE